MRWDEQKMPGCASQPSIRHDSCRTEASQDCGLYSFHRTWPCGQVLAISEPNCKFWILSTSAFV